jgi:hypothetical protein
MKLVWNKIQYLGLYYKVIFFISSTILKAAGQIETFTKVRSVFAEISFDQCEISAGFGRTS